FCTAGEPSSTGHRLRHQPRMHQVPARSVDHGVVQYGVTPPLPIAQFDDPLHPVTAADEHLGNHRGGKQAVLNDSRHAKR
ncbi:MAG: hypothetical protein ACXVEX_14420, partial [Actinomycetota bacterium]